MRETSNVQVGPSSAMEGLCNVARCSFEDCRGEKGYVEGACQVGIYVIAQGVFTMGVFARRLHRAVCICVSCVSFQKPLVDWEILEALVLWIFGLLSGEGRNNATSAKGLRP